MRLASGEGGVGKGLIFLGFACITLIKEAYC